MYKNHWHLFLKKGWHVPRYKQRTKNIYTSEFQRLTCTTLQNMNTSEFQRLKCTTLQTENYCLLQPKDTVIDSDLSLRNCTLYIPKSYVGWKTQDNLNWNNFTFHLFMCFSYTYTAVKEITIWTTAKRKVLIWNFFEGVRKRKSFWKNIFRWRKGI